MLFRLFLMFKSVAKPVVTAERMVIISLLSMIFVAWPTQVMAAKPVILIYGDSLSAGYGLAQHQGWVTLLQNKLETEHYPYTVVNASISGETTSGGLSRFASTLAKIQPEIVLLELGANDGLRGLPLKNMADNLEAIIKKTKKIGVKVLLIGMRIPPNYGPQYTQQFSNTYPQLSKEYQVPLVSFMLENVAAKSQLIQDDGLHPNALAQSLILDNIWPVLKPLLKK
ncbi:MAG: arylesterase [Methylotenera sp.]|nr:arylesterase [Methylotenera sp.]